jgi:hypothetical protein
MIGWEWWLIIACATASAAALAVAWRPLRSLFREVQLERAREMFSLQREHLEARFLQAAAATGKPRGLRWKDCEWTDPVRFARDVHSGKLHALVEVTISFEAVEGGDMEGWPEVDTLRNATAVFVFERGQWHTCGRVLFNMNPDEALVHLKGQFEPVQIV